MNDNLIVARVEIEKVFPNPDNPRKDLGDLTELTESIRKNGIMQNLTVIPENDELNKFIVLIGHRRLAAAKQAGLHYVPCRILMKNIPDKKEQMAIMLEENMQRNDLTIVEQAQGFQMMIDLGYSEDEIAQKTGFSRSTIYHRIALAKLDKEELEKKITGLQLSITDLYLLEQIKDERIRNEVLRSSNSKDSLRWNIQAKLNEIEKEKELNKMRDFVVRLGVKQMPAEMQNKIWSYSVTVLYVLEKGGDWVFTKPANDKDVYFYEPYSSNAMIKIVKVQEGSPVKVDPKQAERERKSKELQAMMEEVKDKFREFMNYIIFKSPELIEDDDETNDLVRDVLNTRSMNTRTIVSALMNKNEWGMSKDEIEQFEDEICKLSTKAVFIFALIAEAIRQNPFGWSLNYNVQQGQRYMRIYNLSKKYGFELKKEHLSIIDGSHDFYEVKEDDE